MVKGKSEMSWYAEVILSYIMVTEKQSDMERRHGSPRIVTSHLFFLTTVQSSLISQVPRGAYVERVMENKNKNLRQTARLFVQKKKMPVDGMFQAKVHQLHHVS